MNYKISDQAIELNAKLEVFMEQYIYTHEKDYDEFTSNQDNLWQYRGYQVENERYLTNEILEHLRRYR